MSVISNGGASIEYSSSSPNTSTTNTQNIAGNSNITPVKNEAGLASPNENRGFEHQGSEDDDIDQDHEFHSDLSQNRQSNKRSKVTRRSIACKSCHALKVKCTPSDPLDPGKPCIRCLNANRKCEIDLNQTRKRRKNQRS